MQIKFVSLMANNQDVLEPMGFPPARAYLFAYFPSCAASVEVQP